MEAQAQAVDKHKRIHRTHIHAEARSVPEYKKCGGIRSIQNSTNGKTEGKPDTIIKEITISGTVHYGTRRGAFTDLLIRIKMRL